MSSLAIHLSILRYFVAIISKLYFLSYLMICFSRNLIGPLSSVASLECHQSSWYQYGVECANSCGFMASVCSFSLPSLASSSAFSLPSMLACACTLYNVVG